MRIQPDLAGIGSVPVDIHRLAGSAAEGANDVVAVEEPLEIRVVFDHEGARRQQSLSITMRTPGADFALAAGFLLTEGIVRKAADLGEMTHCGQGPARGNVVRVELAPGVIVDMAKMQRHFYTTSSCGVCGKSSLEALGLTGVPPMAPDTPRLARSVLHGLPAAMRAAQAVFETTGGLHAAGLFSTTGQLLDLQEDVGRHNAVDKLVGARLLQGLPPASDAVLLLSGRASFEIMQKAVMAGIAVVAAVGAPSSLAVETAQSFGLTLIGFLRDNRGNVYAGAHRLLPA